MKRVNTRGIKQANKHVLMAALTYNLKKYLTFITKISNQNVRVLRREASAQIQTLFFALHYIAHAEGEILILKIGF